MKFKSHCILNLGLGLGLLAGFSSCMSTWAGEAFVAHKFHVAESTWILPSCREGKSRLNVLRSEDAALASPAQQAPFETLYFKAKVCTRFGFRKSFLEVRVPSETLKMGYVAGLQIDESRTYTDGASALVVRKLDERRVEVRWTSGKTPSVEVEYADEATLSRVPGWKPGMLPWIKVRVSDPDLRAELAEVDHE